MECSECGNEVFDIYTTEQRIKDLYKMNTVTGWAKNRLRVLKEMLEDREKGSDLPPVSQSFILKELQEIHDKMVVVG